VATLVSSSSSATGTITFDVPTPIEEVEKGMILATLKKAGRNKTHAAQVLRISLKTLHNKLTQYRIN
jgi:DNA-binding NtrC family response regulator